MENENNQASEMRIQYHDEPVRGARIKVIGVGGGDNLSLRRRRAEAVDGALAAWLDTALPVASMQFWLVGQAPQPELDGVLFHRVGEASDRDAQALTHLPPKGF